METMLLLLLLMMMMMMTRKKMMMIMMMNIMIMMAMTMMMMMMMTMMTTTTMMMMMIMMMMMMMMMMTMIKLHECMNGVRVRNKWTTELSLHMKQFNSFFYPLTHTMIIYDINNINNLTRCFCSFSWFLCYFDAILRDYFNNCQFQ